MKEFKALVLCHYDFLDKKTNEPVKKTKLLVSLGDYGTLEQCIPLNEKLEILSEVKVKLTYKDNKFRIVEVIV